MVKTTRVLFKSTIRSIKTNWGQFLAIIGIATLAVTLFLGLSSSATVFEDRVNRLYEECNIADIWMTHTSISQDEILSFEDAETIASQYNATVERRLSLISTIADRNNYALITPIGQAPTINKPVIVDGASMSENDDYLLVDSTLIGNTIKVGGNVTLSFSLVSIKKTISETLGIEIPEAIPDDIELNFTVTGSMKCAENIENTSYSSGNYYLSLSYLKHNLFQYLKDDLGIDITEERLIRIIQIVTRDSSFNQEKFNEYLNSILSQYVFKCQNSNDISKLKTALKERCDLDNINAAILEVDEMPSNMTIQSDIVQAKQLTYVFPMIFFLVAILVISTTCTQIVLKERTLIGTMKAIGLSKRNILNHYMALMLSLVGIGILLGTIIGPLLIPSVMNIKYSILYSLPSSRYIFPFVAFIGITAAALLIVAICVFSIIRHELNLSPAESMRPSVGKSLKVKEGKKVVSNKLFSWKMAIRNIRLDWIKSLMVVIGVAGCCGLSVCGFGINDTIDNGINVDMNHFYDSDVIMTYSSGVKSIKEEVYNQFQTYIGDSNNLDEMVSNYGTFSSNTTTNEFDANLMMVTGDHPFVKIEIPENTAAITSKVADQLNLKVGDKFTVTSYSQGIAYQDIEVGLIFESFFKQGAVINADDSVFESQRSDLLVSYSQMWINVSEQYKNNIEEVTQEIFDYYKDTYFASKSTKEGTIKHINEVVSSINTITLVVKTFAVLLAVVVVYNFIYLNFKQRIRQMATQKVLGFDNASVAKSFIIEIMILVVIGALFGLAIGFPLEVLVLSINKTALVEYLYYASFKTYLFSFLITCVTALILNIVLSLLIRRIKMVESLKAVE